MDAIRFSCSPVEARRKGGIAVHPSLVSPTAGLYRVHVEIDGTSLVERIREIELPLAIAGGHADLAGRYADPVFGWPEDPPPAAHYLGAPGSDRSCGSVGKTLLLVDGDEEGEEGSWPLMARIDVGPNVITWAAFEQPFRPRWDYGLRLAFDRIAYEEGLAALGPLKP